MNRLVLPAPEPHIRISYRGDSEMPSDSMEQSSSDQTHTEIYLSVSTDMVSSVDVRIAPVVIELEVPEEWFRAEVRASTG